jgi:hypothetical protein
MSLAHLRAPKLERTAGVAGPAVPERVAAASAKAFCGASREPVYRTMDEAQESGLELCDTCLADYRRQHRPGR